MLKHYCVAINERNGNYEYIRKVVLTSDAKNNEELTKEMDNYLFNWYSTSVTDMNYEDLVEPNGELEYYFDGGIVHASISWKECSEQEYETLKKFL